MKIQLREQEIMRAVQVYVGAKFGVPSESLPVKVRWRGGYVEVMVPAKPVTAPIKYVVEQQFFKGQSHD